MNFLIDILHGKHHLSPSGCFKCCSSDQNQLEYCNDRWHLYLLHCFGEIVWWTLLIAYVHIHHLFEFLKGRNGCCGLDWCSSVCVYDCCFDFTFHFRNKYCRRGGWDFRRFGKRRSRNFFKVRVNRIINISPFRTITEYSRGAAARHKYENMWEMNQTQGLISAQLRAITPITRKTWPISTSAWYHVSFPVFIMVYVFPGSTISTFPRGCIQLLFLSVNFLSSLTTSVFPNRFIKGFCLVRTLESHNSKFHSD